MKKYFQFFMLYLFCTITYSQEKQFCGEVLYTQTLSLNSEYIQNFKMNFNIYESYSEEYDIKITDDKINVSDDNGGRTETIVLGRKNKNNEFYYNDRTNIYFKDIYFDKELLVKEEKNLLKWKIVDEKKRIGKYNCKQATTEFRGRKYIAWFAPEIAVPFGPWKFHGLPGLILQVYDEDKIFFLETNKISIYNTVTCEIKDINTESSDYIDINTYSKKKDGLVKAEFAKMGSRMPKGSDVPVWKKNCSGCPKPLEIFDEDM